MDYRGNSLENAKNTSYDNDTSGLTATDVQDAIDELKTLGGGGGGGSGDVTTAASPTVFANRIPTFADGTGDLIQSTPVSITSGILNAEFADISRIRAFADATVNIELDVGTLSLNATTTTVGATGSSLVLPRTTDVTSLGDSSRKFNSMTLSNIMTVTNGTSSTNITPNNIGLALDNDNFMTMFISDPTGIVFDTEVTNYGYVFRVDGGTTVFDTRLTGVTVGANLLPDGDGTRDIGSSSAKFKDIYNEGRIDSQFGLDFGVAIGKGCMTNNAGNCEYSVAIGYKAYEEANSSTENVNIGGYSAQYNRGSENVSVGIYSLQGVTGGSSTGSNNTAVGRGSLRYMTTGANNVCIGYASGDTINTGSQNTIIGATADCVATSANQTALGYGATCTDANEMVLGNASVTRIRSMANCDLGTSSDRFKDLYLSNSMSYTGLTTTQANAITTAGSVFYHTDSDTIRMRDTTDTKTLVKAMPAITSPLELSNCVGWYDASDTGTIVGTSPVTRWDDKSGFGLNLTPTNTIVSGASTINGLNVLDFTVALMGNSTQTIDYYNSTIFIVCYTAPSVGLKTIFWNYANLGINQNGWVEFQKDGGNHFLCRVKDEVNNVTVVTNSANEVETNKPFMYASRITTGTTLDTWNDKGFSTSSILGGIPAGSGRGIRIGEISGAPFTGQFAEVIIYNRSLTNVEVETVSSYLKTKWALNSDYPTNGLRVEGNVVINGALTFSQPRAEFYIEENTLATTLTTIDLWYKIAHNITAESFFNKFFTTDSSNQRMTYTGTNKRVFHCGATLSFSVSNGSNENYEFTIAKNGTAITGGIIVLSAVNTITYYSSAIHCFVELVANDYLELYARNRSGGGRTTTIRYANMFCVAMGADTS